MMAHTLVHRYDRRFQQQRGLQGTQEQRLVRSGDKWQPQEGPQKAHERATKRDKLSGRLTHSGGQTLPKFLIS